MQPPVVHVFASSTWLELQPERQAVEAALHRLRDDLPCFVYFKAENTIPGPWREADPANSAKLDALKRKLRQHHTASEFRNPDELAAKITVVTCTATSASEAGSRRGTARSERHDSPLAWPEAGSSTTDEPNAAEPQPKQANHGWTRLNTDVLARDPTLSRPASPAESVSSRVHRWFAAEPSPLRPSSQEPRAINP